MFSLDLRLKIVKKIHQLKIKSIENDLKENINNGEFADINLANFCQLYKISFRVDEFFTTALIKCN
jgi:hypothetical protein